MQENDEETARHELRRQDDALAAVRRRGAFITTALLLAAAAGGLVITGSYLVVAANAAIDLGERVRDVLGLEVPAAGPDWYLVAVIGLIVLVPTLVVLGLLRWYSGIWNRRIKTMWERRGDRRRYSKVRKLHARADEGEVGGRTAFLQALGGTPAWGGTTHWDATDTTLPADARYRAQAARVLREIEDDVAERAIATGLIVGLGPARFDRLTIVAAALEMQLHVLSRLGKRPSLRTWREIVTRTSASIFFNTYLNGEDTFAVAFAIRRAAIGLDWAGDAGQALATDLGGQDDDDEGIGEFIGEAVAGIPFVGGFARGTTSMAIGLGASGLQAVGNVIEEAGDELLQGALAGGILYYHGMAIAADVLALDQAHRHSAEMSRTPMQGAMRTAGVAGQLLRNQVRRYRSAYRERRRAPLKAFSGLASRVPGRRNDRTEKGGQPSSDASSGTGETGRAGEASGGRTQAWRRLMRLPRSQ